MIREAKVAGQFYPANAASLKKLLGELLGKNKNKETALGLVAPHAGYIFSGKVAGSCFSRVNLTKTVIILGPNHSGLGASFSIMTEGIWKMPLGDVDTDSSLAEEILQASKYLQSDTKAHLYEHSIEVQLPFLQYVMPEVKIVPITISAAELKVYQEIGRDIAKALKKTDRRCLIIASSDMTHYEPQQSAEKKDHLAIQAILELDEKKLLKSIAEFDISICGYGPVASMLSAAKELGAKQARLVQYQTSGEASGDFSSVVGYAGILIK